MIPDELKKAVEALLTSETGTTVSVIETRSIGGGCINEACSLKTTAGRYFIKYNSAAAFPAMFEKEATGLNLLARTHTLTVPEVVGYGETREYAFLLLGYIESGLASRNFWNEFGTKLADLHQNTSEFYGLDYDNYIGSLVQRNARHSNFIDFFILRRLEPQLQEARNKGAFSHGDTRSFESLFNSLHNLLPAEKPALIHGDLWGGNFMISSMGSACLVDPAVYYGHRESDIAMTQLFGGFQPDFYLAYNQAWPMEKGWQKRMEIYNLYPLLVHVNLFGGSYAGQVQRIIRQF
jgi:protein-ribulosamine 3-kinase